MIKDKLKNVIAVAIAKMYCDAIWVGIDAERDANRIPQRELAKLLCYDRGHISRLMSSCPHHWPTVLLLATAVDFDLGTVILPSRQERYCQGYLEGMRSISGETNPSLTRIDVAFLIVTRQSEEWRQAKMTGDDKEFEVLRLKAENLINNRMRSEFNLLEGREREVEELAKLESEWGMEIEKCLGVIAYPENGHE